MNGVVADCPDQDIRVILDNLNTNKPKRDRWLAWHPNIPSPTPTTLFLLGFSGGVYLTIL